MTRLYRDSENNWIESRVAEVDVDEDPQKIKVQPKPIVDRREGVAGWILTFLGGDMTCRYMPRLGWGHALACNIRAQYSGGTCNSEM